LGSDINKKIDGYWYSTDSQTTIKMLAPSSQDFQLSYTDLNKEGSTSDTFYLKYNEDLLPFFMLFHYTPCVCNLFILLVIEKESRIKESLVIIGLKNLFFGLLSLSSTVLLFIFIFFYNYFN